MTEQVKQTLEALRANSMNAEYVETKAEVVPLLQRLLEPGCSVAVGGSMTLAQCGIDTLLQSGAYENRGREGFGADAYLTSANAVTQDGVLYNVDGNSNRVSAISYGPKKVYVIAGANKIVKDLEQAVLRVKTVAAPRNAKRLDCDTPCAKTGACISLEKASPAMTDGCRGDERICCNYLISAKQRHKGRIMVILVGEPLGF